MGAHSDQRTFEAPNEAAALKLATQIMQDACYDGGHDTYAGHIGICNGVRVHRTAKPLTEKQADELLFGRAVRCKKADPGAMRRIGKPGYERYTEGLAQKWGPAILVRIKNTGSRKAKWLLGGMCAS